MRGGQQVRGTAGQACRGLAVVGGPCHSGRGVALGNRREVDRRVAVRAFGLIRQTAVDGGVVDLLRDRFRVERAAAQGGASSWTPRAEHPPCACPTWRLY
jgi:hypothetical protein